MFDLNINEIKNDNSINLLFLGAMHGNEKCGTIAINRVIDMFNNGELELKRGSVTFIPICNPKAYEKDVRDCGINLNRIVSYYDNPASDEEIFANRIASEIEKADYLVDLHSYMSGDTPFCFLDYNNENNMRLINASLGNFFIEGFPEIYEDSVIEDMSTEAFANTIVNTNAITVECGNHYKEDSVDFAFNLILNVLREFKMIEGEAVYLENLQRIKMEKLIVKEKEGILTKDYRNLDRIQKGEVLANYDDGNQIIAEDDFVIILPKSNAPVGNEWFYLGIII